MSACRKVYNERVKKNVEISKKFLKVAFKRFTIKKSKCIITCVKRLSKTSVLNYGSSFSPLSYIFNKKQFA